jgi:ubiquinone/menaquinone biosynthesis C-methylase UbiE
MSVCPLPDLELEKLLKNLRRALLSNILSPKGASPELLSFQSALALQCFTNEYIYSQTEEETKILQSLEDSVKIDLENNEQPNPQIILALASYKAINKYDWCQSLAVTDHIREVFNRQVEEPKHEEKLKKQLQVLEEITDSVSSEVRAQYEESPYPRWVDFGLPLKPMSISGVVDQIKLKLPSYKITEVKNPDILIAGCGTGQHSIGTASRFKGSEVLAIDLSLSSLAYAKRKTEELSVENIDYMQANILDLGLLNKQFDIIECAGTLVCMENPLLGWQILTDCLKPGGLMKIGLYSELARQAVVKIRNEISEQGIGSSDMEMTQFRDEIIKSDKEHHKSVQKYLDFYSLSNLRDLLFHVQEHRFTIPQIKDYLDRLGLKFCGMEITKIVSHFQQTNTDKEDPYNLDKWQAYEEANPQAFQGMYQFWCQKVG